MRIAQYDCNIHILPMKPATIAYASVSSHPDYETLETVTTSTCKPLAAAKETKLPNRDPVGKAGFEVWVLSKGGLHVVSVHHCRLYCTVVHAHLVREGMLTLGCVRVFRYGPVTKKQNFPRG
jgi:hypothetical protein